MRRGGAGGHPTVVRRAPQGAADICALRVQQEPVLGRAYGMGTGVEGLTFETWVRPRLPAFLRFGHLVTGSATAAQDAVQSALAGAFERWERLESPGDADAYVRRAIANARISAWRRFGKRQVVVAEPAVLDHPDHGTRLIEQDAVWRVCAQLPPQQRATVVLRFSEDLDYDEIARMLGCRPANTRSPIHRALIALRNLLAEEDR